MIGATAEASTASIEATNVPIVNNNNQTQQRNEVINDVDMDDVEMNDGNDSNQRNNKSESEVVSVGWRQKFYCASCHIQYDGLLCPDLSNHLITYQQSS